MTITIGAFSCSALTAQPFAYDGEARAGLTQRAFQVSGLLSPEQWRDLISVYDTWRNNRINDPDTLLSGTIGTTVELTINSTNGQTVSNLACWFASAPSGEQLGPYVSATATLIDAAQALQVIQRSKELQSEQQQADAEQPVDCAKIAAQLTRQRDETACELTALAGGLADDFADQQAQREIIEKTADLTARGTYGGQIADLDAQLEIQARTDQLAAAGTYAEPLQDLAKQLEVTNKTAELAINDTYATNLGALDAQLQISNRTAELTNLGTYGADLADLDAQINIANKTNQVTTLGTYGADEAEMDLQIETLQAQNRLAAYQAGDLAALRGALLDTELEENAAEITAISTRIEALKDSRTLKALWDKYLSDGTVPHGTESYGGVTINLTAPPETRSNGPSVSFTATGNTLVSGAAKSMLTKQVVGYTDAAGASGLLSWYDSTVEGPASAGQWFPTQAPAFTTEYVLVEGVKSTRYNVTMTVVQLT